jgi:hypothetical protein
MPERRPRNSELRLRRLAKQEPAPDEERGILELFEDTDESAPDEDAPLAREDEDSSD